MKSLHHFYPNNQKEADEKGHILSGLQSDTKICKTFVQKHENRREASTSKILVRKWDDFENFFRPLREQILFGY